MSFEFDSEPELKEQDLTPADIDDLSRMSVPVIKKKADYTFSNIENIMNKYEPILELKALYTHIVEITKRFEYRRIDVSKFLRSQDSISSVLKKYDSAVCSKNSRYIKKLLENPVYLKDVNQAIDDAKDLESELIKLLSLKNDLPYRPTVDLKNVDILTSLKPELYKKDEDVLKLETGDLSESELYDVNSEILDLGTGDLFDSNPEKELSNPDDLE